MRMAIERTFFIMNNKPLKPAETLDACIEVGVGKANSSIPRLFVLGILAGAFIAFAAQGSNMAAFNLISSPDTFGIGKVLQGAIHMNLTDAGQSG